MEYGLRASQELIQHDGYYNYFNNQVKIFKGIFEDITTDVEEIIRDMYDMEKKSETLAEICGGYDRLAYFHSTLVNMLTSRRYHEIRHFPGRKETRQPQLSNAHIVAGTSIRSIEATLLCYYCSIKRLTEGAEIGYGIPMILLGTNEQFSMDPVLNIKYITGLLSESATFEDENIKRLKRFSKIAVINAPRWLPGQIAMAPILAHEEAHQFFERISPYVIEDAKHLDRKGIDPDIIENHCTKRYGAFTVSLQKKLIEITDRYGEVEKYYPDELRGADIKEVKEQAALARIIDLSSDVCAIAVAGPAFGHCLIRYLEIMPSHIDFEHIPHLPRLQMIGKILIDLGYEKEGGVILETVDGRKNMFTLDGEDMQEFEKENLRWFSNEINRNLLVSVAQEIGNEIRKYNCKCPNNFSKCFNFTYNVNQDNYDEICNDIIEEVTQSALTSFPPSLVMNAMWKNILKHNGKRSRTMRLKWRIALARWLDNLNKFYAKGEKNEKRKKERIPDGGNDIFEDECICG